MNDDYKIRKSAAIESKRFIMSASIIVVLTIASLFPMYIINKGSNIGVFDMTAAWTAWGIIYSGIVTAGANYVIKESNNPSLFGFGGMGLNLPKPRYKELKNHEDMSDPEDMPL
jgi:hypothetical protein